MNNNQTNMNEAFNKWLKENYPDYPPFPQDVWQAATKASELEINSLEERVAELEDKISIELKRVSALKSLRESYEKELEHYRKHDYSLAKSRLDNIEQSLNSEREMNQTLTNENIELQAHVNKLREALEDIAKHTPENFWQNKASQQALSSTPEQSLAEFENEVIERCAKACKDDWSVTREVAFNKANKAIRALKTEKQKGNK